MKEFIKYILKENLPKTGIHSTAGRIVIGKCCPINCLNNDLIVENVLFI